MTGPNFADEIDCGSFFDHIDDLLDFPNEDIEAEPPAGKPDSLPTTWSAQPESLPGSNSVFSANGCSSLSAELSVPYEDIVQLEWLSTFVEDSFSGGSLTMSKDQISNGGSSTSNRDSSQQFQTSSPVSVLESSSSCSVENRPGPPRSPEAVNPAARCGRARSKRPRPATFNPRPAIQLAPQQSSGVAESEPGAGNCEESDYPPAAEVPKKQAGGAEPKKKKKIKFTMPSAPPAEADQCLPPAQQQQQQAVRKCLHCEITKTPQWRAGPLGPKTLCNACGVRYKSGRLFPEYRPAASPTFIPSLHSNSHKKVLEMRNKPTDAAGAASAVTETLELIPNMSHRLDYM